ncbi:Zn-dependent alcohol dehydrogenase [Tardiphaga sp. P9-11]|uniref:Zn-dependent alcohol dehydrogenase n=1 Tax=Tardiphaga sp. P9-11 TaxID=2024614 RepID=UPI0011F2EA3C|nr:Zn-dependent alcohol dehydrogenase [Tardiphaga sp. P9-11]KAA0073963.1 alcohol dehydrogenase [Tardiphaga sp. P9-11]
MKAAVLNSFSGKFDIEELEIGKPLHREVLVEVKACGLCHSDLHLAEANYGTPLPAVLGHEVAGIVREVGPEVHDFAVGDHVVGSLIQTCGHCRPCIGGRSFQCDSPNETLRPAAEGQRITRNGQPVTTGFGTAGFAEYALIHENQLVRVPKELPFPQASLLGCSVITGAGAAINTAGMRPGDRVVVIGVGGVGLNAISGAKLAGAEQIIAIDLQPEKEALALKFGATHFVNPSAGDAVATVRKLSGGGVDHAFEVIGLVPTSQQAVQMARVGGGAYLIGLHRPGMEMALQGLDVIVRQVKLQGVFMGSSNIKHDVPMYADLYLQGRFNLDDLISRTINISEINQAYEDLKRGAVARSVITSF